MKKNSTRFPAIFFSCLLATFVQAQCPIGTTAAELNWDHLDFLPSNNNRYTSFYPSAAFPYTQHFAMGTRTVRFTMAPAANITLNGENGTNTANGLSPAVANGDDVQFTTTSSANTSITISFDAEVANLQFSLFDLDNSQRVTVTSIDAAGIAQTVLLNRASGTSGITLGGTATNPTATGPSGGYGNTDTRGAINISIAAASEVVLTFSNASGDIWLSDIDACITGAFPTGYQAVSRPFDGQPQYVLTVVNNNIYYVDPTNGQGYFLFNEPGHDRLNSMAYDPYRRVVYYTYSLTDRAGLNPRVDKTLKKYDVDAKTISVVIPNVNTFGIPTYESGVESGAATFYNGSLYLGIEGYTGEDYAASRKSTIWKIDFDAAGNAVPPAVQVFGITADNGSDAQNIHDWSDFGITNGVLIDFDGSVSGDIDYYHFNLMTGARTRYAPTGGIIPRQVSIGWDEKLYNVDAAISLYNGTNGVGTLYTITAPIGPTIPVGSSRASWGDAAGPYRPFLDFGDAPASYDPDTWSPACHDTLTPNAGGRRTKMILGAGEDLEWLKKGFTTVEDNFEDGLAFVPIYSPVNGTYLARVTAFNNSGVPARIGAWLDYNGNGVFDAAEGISPVNVPSSAAVQTFDLSWSGLPNLLPHGAYTYLRIRITTASFGMTAANATGYYSTGEVEDYRVVVENFPLPLTLLSFDARVAGQSVQTNWQVVEDGDNSEYEVERSINGAGNWERVNRLLSSPGTGRKEYRVEDHHPHRGTSWYRLKIRQAGLPEKFSEIKMVRLAELYELRLAPNPADKQLTLTFYSDVPTQAAQVNILGMTGYLLHAEKRTVTAGDNQLQVLLQDEWPAGTYIIQVITEEATACKKFLIRR